MSVIPTTDERKSAGQEAGADAIQASNDAIRLAAEREGITCEYLAKKLKRELNAKETKVFNPKGNSKAEGLIYSKPLVLWDIRQKARMDAQKLIGLYAPTKLDITDERMVQVILDALPVDLAESVRESIKAKAKKL